MSPSKVRVPTVMQKSTLVDDMLRGLASLPLTSLEAFQGDARDAAAAESFLRRALEALLDLGRHILGKGLGERALESKQVALALRRAGVLDEARGDILFDMAGYRNRLTHFYDEVTTAELFTICAQRSAEIRQVATPCWPGCAGTRSLSTASSDDVSYVTCRGGGRRARPRYRPCSRRPPPSA